MDIRIFGPVLIAAAFGLIVAGLELFIAGDRSPWPVWRWLSRAWVYACFCYIILFGVITAG